MGNALKCSEIASYGVEDQNLGLEHPIRILLVDDDPIFNRLITRVARKAGVELTALDTVSDYKATLAANEFDIVVLDYFLKGQEKGTDLAFAVKGLPVVLVSQKSDWSESNEAWPFSIRAFLPKRNGVDAILSEVINIALKTRDSKKEE